MLSGAQLRDCRGCRACTALACASRGLTWPRWEGRSSRVSLKASRCRWKATLPMRSIPHASSCTWRAPRAAVTRKTQVQMVNPSKMRMSHPFSAVFDTGAPIPGSRLKSESSPAPAHTKKVIRTGAALRPSARSRSAYAPDAGCTKLYAGCPAPATPVRPTGEHHGKSQDGNEARGIPEILWQTIGGFNALPGMASSGGQERGTGETKALAHAPLVGGGA